MTRELADIQNETNGPESVRATLARTMGEVRTSMERPEWIDENRESDWHATPAPIRDRARKHAAQLKERADDYDGALDEEVRQEIKRRGGKPGELLGNAVGWVRNLSGPNGAAAYVELGRRFANGEALGVQMHNDIHQRQEQANKIVADWSRDKQHFERVRGRMASLVEQDSNSGGRRFLSKDGSVDMDAAYREACREAGIAAPASRASSSPARAAKRPAPESVRASIRKAIGALR